MFARVAFLALPLAAAEYHPQYFRDVDSDQDGSITLPELQASLSKSFPSYNGGFPFSTLSKDYAPLLEAQVRAFNALDRDRDGKLTTMQFTK